MEEIRGTPQQPNPEGGGRIIMPQVRFDPPNEQEPVESVPLRKETVPRMKLKKEYFKKYGWTEGCEGCRVKREGRRSEQREHTVHVGEGLGRQWSRMRKEGGYWSRTVRGSPEGWRKRWRGMSKPTKGRQFPREETMHHSQEQDKEEA